MFIRYQFVDKDHDMSNIIYLNVENVEINTSLHTCMIIMSTGYTAEITGEDICEFICALEQGDHVFDFNQLSADAKLYNKYGDALSRYEGVTK